MFWQQKYDPQEKKTELKKERNYCPELWVGKLWKKYRCSNALQNETGLSRKNIRARITNEEKQIDVLQKRKPQSQSVQLKTKVVEFLEKSDVST